MGWMHNYNTGGHESLFYRHMGGSLPFLPERHWRADPQKPWAGGNPATKAARSPVCVSLKIKVPGRLDKRHPRLGLLLRDGQDRLEKTEFFMERMA